MGLLIEEALLRCRDRFGREQTVAADFSGLASARVTLRLKRTIITR
ncbi:MAG: hypothetical protein K6C08_15540 [Oscillospiraceae bacterium]|nr:hypothetical protein [Oscillospiraceae bacterium]